MDLVIDMGNTLCKAGVFNSEGNLLFREREAHFTSERIVWLCETYPVRRSILSSVRTDEPEWIGFLASRTRMLRLSHASHLPVRLEYDSLPTLGTDRIANAAASVCFFPKNDVLSIQAGSCIVYDFTDRHGVYHGGAISPGLQMRFNALRNGTGELPLTCPGEIKGYLGKDTQQSIKSGVINGLIFEIQGFISQYRRDYPSLTTVLTGGDAEYLKKGIREVDVVDADFVLKGLHEILKMNVEEI